MVFHAVVNTIEIGDGVLHILGRISLVLVMNCRTAVFVVLDVGMRIAVMLCHVILQKGGALISAAV